MVISFMPLTGAVGLTGAGAFGAVGDGPFIDIFAGASGTFGLEGASQRVLFVSQPTWVVEDVTVMLSSTSHD
jgi:hypothetical protein